MQCKFVKPDGTLCNANALKDNLYCFQHTRLTMQKDEQNLNPLSANKLVISLPDIKIDDVNDLPDFLIDTIRNVRGHVIDAKVGSVIGYLTNILLRSYEVADLQNRVERIEKLVSNSFVEVRDDIN